MQLLLTLLVLVPFCGGQEWKAPEYCRGSPCPQFTVVEKQQDFEERLYVASTWITTNIPNPQATDLLSANARLKSAVGHIDSWPVQISITNGEDYSLSWFIPPAMNITKITDPSVQLENRPEVNVYVRVFGGTPSIESGKENAEKLCDSLRKAGKTCSGTEKFVGNAYESYFSITHHDEVWIDKTQ
ncbi:hypothetical protein PBY51_014746 [Eleginops maclovinus]|uniref:Heme-binding protein 2 n=1 Tax=Eleginops maclovinus TaxID=56733 RepID=A0AAN7WWX7_ELEMC|nr:hypothetical protein PBY51_014746 [Eleginops maclovinus]